MATCTVTGKVTDSSETALASVDVTFRPVAGLVSTTLSALFVPKALTVATDTSGNFTMTLSQGLSGVMEFRYPPDASSTARLISYAVSVPALTSADFSAIITE